LLGSTDGTIAAFRGVPFAQPPVGAGRFQAPQPALRWDGLRPAKHFAPAAPQCADDPMPLPNTISDWSEDCLYLNIWTPGVDDAKRPVMVWFHGGGFVRGSATRPTYDRATLARRGDVVFVTIGYRLGALGFLYHEALQSPANLGLRDQICALEWVAAEIAAFGGDPGNVTAFGHSAGASSIATLLAVPSARGLFRRAILQSGAPTALEPHEATQVAETFFAQLAVAQPTTQRLQELAVGDILAAQRASWNAPGRRPLGWPFLPVIDGDFLPVHPLAGTVRPPIEVDLLVGTARDEMRPYALIEPSAGEMNEDALHARCAELFDDVPADALLAMVRAYRRELTRRGSGANPADIWFALVADHYFRGPLTRLAGRHTANGGNAHSYLFTWASPLLEGVLGAFHELELPFVMGYLDDPFAAALVGDRPERWALAEDIQDAWVSFARCGVPQAQRLPEWQRYEPRRQATMVLDGSSRLEECRLDVALQALLRVTTAAC